MRLDLDALGQMYGGWNDKSGGAAKYHSQDSEYRTYKPELTALGDGGYQVKAKLDHLRTGANDDHSTLVLIFDGSGLLVSGSADWTEGDTPQIPSFVFTVAGIAAATAATAVVGVVASPVGAAVFGAVVAPLIKPVFSVGGAMFNYVVSKAIDFSDDGGRLNFTAVIWHNVNKITASIRPE